MCSTDNCSKYIWQMVDSPQYWQSFTAVETVSFSNLLFPSSLLSPSSVNQLPHHRVGYARNLTVRMWTSRIAHAEVIHKLLTINHIRKKLDRINGEMIYPTFELVIDKLTEYQGLKPFIRLENRTLITLDGSQFHHSHTIKCAHCTLALKTSRCHTLTVVWVPSWWHPGTTGEFHWDRNSSPLTMVMKTRIANKRPPNDGWASTRSGINTRSQCTLAMIYTQKNLCIAWSLKRVLNFCSWPNRSHTMNYMTISMACRSIANVWCIESPEAKVKPESFNAC